MVAVYYGMYVDYSLKVLCYVWTVVAQTSYHSTESSNIAAMSDLVVAVLLDTSHHFTQSADSITHAENT